MSSPYAVYHQGLGGLVLLEPALRKLNGYHSGRVRLLGRADYAPLVELMSGVTCLTGFPILPAHHLYAFDPSGRSAVRSALAPAIAKCCMLHAPEKRPWFLHIAYGKVISPPACGGYVAEVLWKRTPVPESEPFSPPQLATPPDDWKPAHVPPGPFVLIAPVAESPEQCWNPTRWHEVLAALNGAGAPPCAVSTGGLSWQVAHVRSIADGFGTAAHWLCGPTSVREFLWLCSRARLVISLNGGANHLAAAFTVPSVTLFGESDPFRWFWPSSIACGIQAGLSKDGVRRMGNLPASAVIRAALEALES